jgi:hypothetical protein
LTNQLLRCTHLHSVLVKIVFLKCSVHDVCAVATALNLLGSWMTSLAQALSPPWTPLFAILSPPSLLTPPCLAQRLLADAQRSASEHEAAPVSQA